MNQHSIYYLVLIFSFLLTTTGCWSSQASSKNPLHINHTDPMIVLFSDENSIYEEAHFYDALLEIQRNYPNENFPFQFVYSTDKDAVKFFNVTEYPTLIVLDQEDNIILRLDDSILKEEIIDKLLMVFEVDITQEL